MPVLSKKRRVSTVRFNNPDISKCGDKLIFRNQHLPELHEGLSFLFDGFISFECEKFTIIFKLDSISKDVALLVSPNLLQNWIGRNSRVRNKWQRQDISALVPFPLKTNSKFFLQIFITEGSYMIAFNGQHYAEYRHRLPYSRVACIEVSGRVQNLHVQYATFPTYPEPMGRRIMNPVPVIEFLDYEQEPWQNIPKEFMMIKKPQPNSWKSLLAAINIGLPVPYCGHLKPKSLTIGRCIKIVGRIKMLPTDFSIDLQRGHHTWPHPIVALRFNPRYSEKVKGRPRNLILCSSFYKDSWLIEEHPMLLPEFQPGRIFTLVIVSGTQSFDVYVNQKFTTKFTYRVRPDIVDTILIRGDIRLWEVLMANKVRLKAHQESLQLRRRTSIFRKRGTIQNS